MTPIAGVGNVEVLASTEGIVTRDANVVNNVPHVMKFIKANLQAPGIAIKVTGDARQEGLKVWGDFALAILNPGGFFFNPTPL